MSVSGLEIRAFAPDDAEPVAVLLSSLAPASIQTADSIRHRQLGEPSRARRQSWVATAGGDTLGFATAYLQWFGGEVGKGRLWVGVREDRRKRGIGTQLWDRAVAHLADAKKLTVEVDADPAGLLFVEGRGFAQYDAEVISRLDPRESALELKPTEGFRTVALREVRARDLELFEFVGVSGGIPLGDPANRVTLKEWRRFIVDNPALDDDASVVVVDANERIVSLSWLLIDRSQRRAENEWTATLPELRGRGLARLAKIATIRWAAAHAIREILTGNDLDNLPMRELNRALGYQELFTRRDMEAAAKPG
ncbi:MAG: GNAT family N-acetyltransferase [Actinobacteria bacterium]|nr:GNAT family N-acetyltransferase [Actinomycetota bacterium]